MMSDLRFYKRLLDHLNTAVLLLDQALLLRYMNPAAEALLSLSAARALGRPLPSYLLADEDAAGALQRCLDQGHPFTRREARLCNAAGRDLTVDYSVSPLAEPDQPGNLLIEMQPLDRLLRISREDALVQSHQATRALVRGVAHELKNPLGGIRGAAQLLERALPDADLKEYTRVIIDEADRLRGIADRMLGPRRLPEVVSINLHECLEHVRQLVLAEHNGALCIERDYDPSLPEIRGDRDQLIQVFLNLLRNAVQALTEASTVQGRVTLRSRVLRQFTIGSQRHRLVARIEIEDNGPGVPPALQEMLFYPMVSGRANGSGLGLSISQAIVGQHQGLIECQSEPGKTVFSVLLPVDMLPAQEEGEQ